MIVITTALYAGTPTEAANRKDAFYTPTAQDAVHAIAEGATAFIPLDGWKETAGQVLQHWATDEQVEIALHFAEYGRFPGGNVDAW